MAKGKQRTILLVEDEAIIAMTEAQAIEDFGYRVLTADSGESAVELAIKNPDIDLILMDIDLGEGIDGPEAAQRILKKRHVPIVFLTSHPEEEYVSRVREITRYGYVIKNSGDFVLRSSIETAFELYESEERYRAAFRTSPDAISISTMDGEYVDVNEGFSRLTGFSRDEAVGTSSVELGIWADPAGRGRLVEGLERNGFVENLEAVCRTKQGSVKTCLISARVISLTNTPHILSVVKDISERKRMQERLIQGKSLLTEMGRVAKIGAWKVDTESGRTQWTDELYEIYEVEPGHSLHADESMEFVTPEYRELAEGNIRRTMESGEPFDMECEIITAKGNRRRIRVIGKADSTDGRITTRLGVTQDISDTVEKEV